MADGERQFDYVAVDSAGRRVKGRLAAGSDEVAFNRLKRDGYSPLRIRAAEGGQKASGRAKRLNDRETAEFLSDLATLLRAGADMRSALGVLAARSGRPAVMTLSRALNAEISGGGALDQAFTRHLGKNQAFIGALVTAGEAAGDLASGLARAAEMLNSRSSSPTSLSRRSATPSSSSPPPSSPSPSFCSLSCHRSRPWSTRRAAHRPWPSPS